MNIRQFEYVLALAELKHFEMAADACSVSQSTLSTMVSRFEEEMGIHMFNRKKKPVQLTHEGALLMDQIKRIHAHIEQLHELTKEIKGEISGKVSISVIPTVAPFLLPLFVQDFAGQFPQLEIIVREETTVEIQRKLKSRELDIGILSIPLQDKEIVEQHLYDEPFVYFDAAKEGLEGHVSVSDIQRKNLCLMEDGHCIRTQVLHLCEEGGRKHTATHLNFEYKAGSIDGLLRFVKANRGATLLPYLATVDFQKNEKCHVQRFAPPVPYRSIGLVTNPHFAKKKLLERLQQLIVQNVSPLLPTASNIGTMIPPL
jgi:LysR family hydrogen peroxide-inducible transcriptional activator